MNPSPLPITPCAECGCALAVHRQTVGADWRWGPADCLVCDDCPEFVAPGPVVVSDGSEAAGP